MLEFNKLSHGDADFRNSSSEVLICSRGAVLAGHAGVCGLRQAGGPGHEKKRWVLLQLAKRTMHF